MDRKTGLVRAIQKVGSLTKFAAALSAEVDEEVSPQTVGNWRRRGMPPSRCRAIEKLTGISVRQLRPKDWRRYWPD